MGHDAGNKSVSTRINRSSLSQLTLFEIQIIDWAGGLLRVEDAETESLSSYG